MDTRSLERSVEASARDIDQLEGSVATEHTEYAEEIERQKHENLHRHLNEFVDKLYQATEKAKRQPGDPVVRLGTSHHHATDRLQDTFVRVSRTAVTRAEDGADLGYNTTFTFLIGFQVPPIPAHCERNYDDPTVVYDLLGDRFKVVEVAEEHISHTANLMDKESLESAAESTHMIRRAFGQKELNPFNEIFEIPEHEERKIRTSV